MDIIPVEFPVAASYGTQGGPQYLTEIARLASGSEEANAVWSEGLGRWRIQIGNKRIEDLERVQHFLHRVRGRARGFLIRDPLEHKSCLISQDIAGSDQLLGTGDGSTVRFRFVVTRTLDGWTRSFVTRRVVASSVLVEVAGVPVASGFSVDDTAGWLTLDTPPAVGVDVRAGWHFLKPVRFEADWNPATLDNFRQGTAQTLTVREIREEDPE